MTYTYKTPTPHGRCRDLLVDEMLRKAEEAAEADRVIVLDKGRIAADGTPHEIFSDTEMLTRLGILPPQCADVMNGLREAGFPVGAGITPEECADQISQTVIARG